ncbi:hypothetical protein CWI36_0386p0010 [Hamiltosporidium magnivora]|uniref:Uncharacterized protein n=1 Tax=Hamiltosporidium magnivora TaxID=148818 RepID=A0A4V2JW66_9MICR|nr:hypothetical protein CWI36_0679p0010 [Hamiltosporidium magnivora]TBU06752.1 hypothetical protein CWI36_0386p0010 [Hamiltosporidium magnivora]
MNKKTKQVIFVIGGSILIFLILGLVMAILNANRLCKNLQKEFIEFENSEVGAQVLKTCQGSDKISLGFAVLENSKKILFPLGVCFKNYKAVNETIRILFEKLYKCLTKEEENKVRKLSADTSLIFIPWVFEMESLKEFCKKYKPNLFQRIGLFFLKNKNLLLFIPKYVESFDQAFQKKPISFGSLEQYIYEETVKFKIKSIEDTFPCPGSSSQDMSAGTDIDFRSDRNLDWLLFFMYKSCKNNPEEIFKEILNLLGENVLSWFSENLVRLVYFFTVKEVSNPEIEDFISKLKDKTENDCVRIVKEYNQSKNFKCLYRLGKLISEFAIEILWESFLNDENVVSIHLNNSNAFFEWIRNKYYGEFPRCENEDNLYGPSEELMMKVKKLIEEYKDILKYVDKTLKTALKDYKERENMSAITRETNIEVAVSFLRKTLLDGFLTSENQNMRTLKFFVKIFGLILHVYSDAVHTIDFIEDFTFKLILPNLEILRSVISK